MALLLHSKEQVLKCSADSNRATLLKFCYVAPILCWPQQAQFSERANMRSMCKIMANN
jgi:hypothetical protein